MRRTEQKDAIHKSLLSAGRPLSAQEVLELAQVAVPGLGIATVYRQLKALVRDGIAIPVELAGEASRYELADREHHHHFRCTACGRVFDVPGCPGTIGARVPEGFVVEDHEVILYGRCKGCASG